MSFATSRTFDAAVLAEIAYLDLTGLSPGDGGALRDRLTDQGIPESLADYVVQNFELASFTSDPSSGFRAGVFRSTRAGDSGQLYLAFAGTDASSLADLLTDLALTLTGTPYPQLNPFISFLQAATITHAGDFVLTGHSLGGHLAHLAADYLASRTDETFTFNGAGVGGAPAFLASVRRYVAWLWSHDSAASNIIAEAGFEVVSSPLSGIRPGRHFLSFIEDQTGVSSTGAGGSGPIGNHGISHLVDSIAVYRAFETIADTSGQADDVITGILEAASRFSLDSLEVALNQLAAILGVASSAALGDRQSLHTTAAAVSASWPGDTFTLRTLVGLSSSELIALAQENSARGVAVRYALVNAVPFFVDGRDYSSLNSDGRYDLAEFSEEYFRARADWFRASLQVAADDNVGSGGQIFVVGAAALGLTSGRFITVDGSIATSIQVTNPNGPQDFGMRIFGQMDAGSSLTGGADADQLFGGRANDTLYGGDGSAPDYLEGGRGFDTYIYQSNGGRDRIFDSDGGGEIIVNGISLNGANGGTPLWDPLHSDDEVWTWASGDVEFRFALVGGDLSTGGDLWIYGEAIGDGGRIIIEDWDQGDLGITLTDNRPIALLPESAGQNPFTDPSFVPQTETTQLNEESSRTITLALSFAAQAGQIARISVSDLGDSLRLVNGAETLSFVNGEVQLTLAAGQTFITFALLAGDIDANTSIDLTAELLPLSGTGSGPTATLVVELQGEAEVTNAPPTAFSNVFIGTDANDDDSTNGNFWGDFIENAPTFIDVAGGNDERRRSECRGERGSGAQRARVQGVRRTRKAAARRGIEAAARCWHAGFGGDHSGEENGAGL